MQASIFSMVLWAAATTVAAAQPCLPLAPELIYAACAGQGRAELRLLPEDAAETPDNALDITGGYTAVDLRKGGKPKPVGLMVRGGEIVNREYVRFDGVLTIDAQNALQVQYRRAVSLGGGLFDLNDAGERRAFLNTAAREKASIIQSHLLILNGEVDVAPRASAPRFWRRILFQTAAGYIGVYDSSPRALTLYEVAEEVAQAYAPVMALNLDMGSYDFCRRGRQLCGYLAADAAAKLSNIIRLYAPE
jgi:hypothetical protein